MSGNFTNRTLYFEPEGPFEYKLAIGWIYFVIVVVGFIGNIAIVIVTCSKPWRGTALSVILIALAISDILHLLSYPLTFFVGYVYDINVSAHSEALCKLLPFMVYASHLTSTWLLVSVVFERMLNVVVPRDSITRWTHRPLVAVVVVIAIWVVCYAINTHFLTHLGLTDDTEYKYCSHYAISEDYAEFAEKQHPWFDLFISLIVPYPMAVFGSIVILNNAKIQQLPTRSEPTSTSRSLPRTTFRVTLLILSITSIVTIGPRIINNLYRSYDYSPKQLIDWFYIMFIRDVLAALAHTNTAVRFYLYAISNKEFRVSLLAMVGRKPRATTYTRLTKETIQGRNGMETFNNETQL